MFIDVILSGILLTGAVLVALRARQSTGDARLSFLIFAALALRLIVGLINAWVGPLPGAEADAVEFVGRAKGVSEGHLWDIPLYFGPYAYSSLLSILYTLGAQNELIPTLLNNIFTAGFLLTVYRIAAEEGNRARARTATLIAAFFPLSVLYTAVPLREALLLWAFAIVVRAMLRYARSRAKPTLNVLFASLVLLVLHSAFIILIVPAGVLAILSRSASIRGPAFRRSEPLVVFAGSFSIIVIVAVLAVQSGELSKLPSVADLDSDFLLQLRQSKAHGEGAYLGELPSGLTYWAFTPLMVLRFLFSPLIPDVLSNNLSLVHTIKILDAGLYASLTVSIYRAIRAPLTVPTSKLARTTALMVLIIMIVAFAMGTANVGLAIRHRAKFAWLMGIIAVVWRPMGRGRVFLRRQRMPASTSAG